MSSDAEKVTGYTYHGLNQVIGRNNGRGVNIRAMFDAIKAPAKIVEQANGAIKYEGKNATVILNHEGKVITAYGKPRGSKVWDSSGVVQPLPDKTLPFYKLQNKR